MAIVGMGWCEAGVVPITRQRDARNSLQAANALERPYQASSHSSGDSSNPSVSLRDYRAANCHAITPTVYTEYT